MGKILVVEDELSIQKVLEFDLNQSGFQVDLVGTGTEGLEKGESNSYDVILLDVMLPGLDGFSVCKRLREKGIQSHIVMLSARDEEFNRIMGLEVGADDYMTKPFSTREVVGKIKAILRRKQMGSSPEATVDSHLLIHQGLRLDTQKVEAWIEGQVINFTLKEFEMLALLMKNKDKVLSRNMLLDQLWGMEYFGETRVVDVHIFKIRDKLKPFGIKIKTVRGIGYKLEDENGA